MPDRLGREPVPATARNPAAAVILAAGEGTRMRSARPKVLHPIAGRTLLGHAVHAAAATGPEQLVAVIGHGRELVAAEVAALAERLERPVLTAVQDKQLGTGHAVRCGLDALPTTPDGPVLVSYGDVPLLEPDTLRALLAAHHAAQADVTVLTFTAEDPTGYGRILRDADGAADGTVTGIVEQADATTEQQAVCEVNSGVYVFDGAYLAAALDRLDTANSQGEFYLTDLIAMAGRAIAVHCDDAWQAQGINDRVQLADVRAELNRRIVRRWMLAGVTVVDPATTWLDSDVVLEPDVVLHPGVQLHGTTYVATGAAVGPDTTLTGVTVGPDAVVVRTHGSDAEIGPGASVGPYAFLRPGARLGERGKIGTFVEVKNADIGAGSKVPHLTYVGDATIGEGTNIGASSVFVNYDGVRKHRTEIGSQVRSGSDTMFVAPVRVGDGAYVGAGTVLREDVPPGALAVSAGPQRTIEGWVERRRPGTAAADAARTARERAATDPDTDPDRTDGARP
ncbi:MAG: bifunctional UDP-N-acetylglucosamine diphosphorylase/glucosamine-1-phosphate N-acetyltransferase GlmU [Pseudonocardia sp.]